MSEQNAEDRSGDGSIDAIRLANFWIGRRVMISGVGGTICVVDADNDQQQTTTGQQEAVAKKKVKTKHGKGTLLLVERPPQTQEEQFSSNTSTSAATIPPGAVAFRVLGTQKYLTMMIYDDQARQDTSSALASIPSLLSDHIPGIVDYAIDRPTEEGNFEGAGFNYSPMIIQDGPPNKLQLFTLEFPSSSRYYRNPPNTRLGVKSLFGCYWRSQHWDKIVSQSPHLLGDETWNFQEQEVQNRLLQDW